MTVVPNASGAIFGNAATAHVPFNFTFAAGSPLYLPYGLAFDSAGNLFVPNQADCGAVTILPRTSGTIFGQAATANVPMYLNGSGGPGCGVGWPLDVAFDAAGRLFVSQYNENTIRVVSPAAGAVFGQAVAANILATLTAATGSVSNPNGIAISPAGDLAIYNAGSMSVTVIPAASGTFLGQAVIANTPVVFTAAAGMAGVGVAFDAAGSLYLTRTNNTVTKFAAPPPSSGSQGSAAIPRSLIDGAAGQVYLYAGGGFSAGSRIDAITWHYSGPAGRLLTPILVERTSPDVFVIRGVGTPRTATTGLNTAPFALQYGSDVTTNGNFTWGFINSSVVAPGIQTGSTTGAVDFDYAIGGDGIGGPGTTNTWYFTPSSFGLGNSLATGLSFGHGVPATYGLDAFEIRAYSAYASTVPAAPGGDTTPPTIIAPPAVTVTTGPENTSGTVAVTLGAASASDDSGTVTVTSDHADGEYPIGTTTVTWTATDPSGNSAQATQLITVIDDTAPTVTAPAGISTATGPGNTTGTVSVALGAATASDNSGSVSVGSSMASGSEFAIGTTTVTWTATDPSSNTATAPQIVTVTDDTPPVIVAPAITAYTGPGATTGTAVVSFNATVTDNSGTVTFNSSLASSATLAIGPTTVAWSAQDLAGNTATANQLITVVDDTPPTITVPPPVSVTPSNSNTTGTWPVTLGSATASDNSGSVTVSSSHVSGSQFPYGTTTVTWTATDPSGNTATATQQVVVVDTRPPKISAPARISVRTGPGNTSGTVAVNLGTPTVTDRSQSTVVTSNPASGSQFRIGRTVVVWTASDSSGNQSTDTQVVTVVDDTPPVVTPPPALNLSTGPGSTEHCLVIAYPPLAAFDNSGTVSATNNAPPCIAVGSGRTISWTVEDPSGNTRKVTQDVFVADNTPPVLANPSSFTFNTAANDTYPGGADVSFASIAPAASDNSRHVQLSASFPGVSNWTGGPRRFPIGTTTVTWRASDPSGSIVTKTQTITIRDTTPPKFKAPANISVTISSGSCAVVSLGDPTASDNSGSVFWNSNPRDSSCFPIGTTTVSWLASDPAGNRVNDTQRVTVRLR